MGLWPQKAASLGPQTVGVHLGSIYSISNLIHLLGERCCHRGKHPALSQEAAEWGKVRRACYHVAGESGRGGLWWGGQRPGLSPVFLRPRENKQEASRGPGAANPEDRLRVTGRVTASNITILLKAAPGAGRTTVPSNRSHPWSAPLRPGRSALQATAKVNMRRVSWK